MPFQSTKVIDGLTACFRQWKAEDTHCKYLHGYSVSFKIVFEGELDERNWVVDFGFLKRTKVKIPAEISDGVHKEKVGDETMTLADWFKFMFDHTTCVAEDDPELELFQEMAGKGIIQLRVLPAIGCEMFAKFVFDFLSDFIEHDKRFKLRTKIVSVECREHSKNSAIYIG